MGNVEKNPRGTFGQGVKDKGQSATKIGGIDVLRQIENKNPYQTGKKYLSKFKSIHTQLSLNGQEISGCELRVAGYELRVASYELRVAGCELRVAGCEFRVSGRSQNCSTRPFNSALKCSTTRLYDSLR